MLNKHTDPQESNSGKQHYLRAIFTRAGSYCLAVAVVDPVSSETVQVPPHSASSRLVILPGAAVAEQTHISDLPEHLTAGKTLMLHTSRSHVHELPRMYNQSLKPGLPLCSEMSRFLPPTLEQLLW